MVTLSIDAASTATGSTFTGGVTSTTCTTTGGTCTVQINATSTGTTVVDAHASPQAGPTGNTIAVPTGNASVTKTWVKSKIALSLTSNPDIVGSGPETVTATVQVDNGTGTFVNAPNGTVVSLSIDAASTAPGSAFVGGTSTTTCTLSAGICTVQITATGAGTTVVDANASPQAGPAGNTIAVPTGNATVTKTWTSPPSGGGGGTPAISITKNPKTQTIDDRQHGELHDRRDEHRHPDAQQRDRLGPAVAELQPDELEHPGTRLDGTRRERDLQLLALERHRELHQRRDRDGHGLERPDRHGDRLRAGDGHRSDPAAAQVVVTHPAISIVKDPKSQHVGAGRHGALQDHGHEHR